MSALRMLGLGVALALASVAVQRVGPRVTVSGEGFCGAEALEPCTVAALGGGWPAAFLVDNPQISVPNQLSVGEDDVRWGAFALNVAVWVGLVAGSGALRRRRNPRRAGGGTP